MRIIQWVALGLSLIFGLAGLAIVVILTIVALQAYLSSGRGLWEWLGSNRTAIAGITAGFVSALAVLATVLLALPVAWFQLGSVRKASNAQVRVALIQIWDSAAYIRARHKIDAMVKGLSDDEAAAAVKKALETAEVNAELDYFLLTRVPDLLEWAIMLADDGYVPQETVRKDFQGPIQHYYKLFSSYLPEARQHPLNKGLWEGLEKWAKRLGNR